MFHVINSQQHIYAPRKENLPRAWAFNEEQLYLSLWVYFHNITHGALSAHKINFCTIKKYQLTLLTSNLFRVHITHVPDEWIESE